jgi:predicted Zn-dependent protease with MMP-like domain
LKEAVGPVIFASFVLAARVATPSFVRPMSCFNATMNDEEDDENDGDEMADAHLADGLAQIWEAYRVDDMPRALAAGKGLITDRPDHGESWYWYGCVQERLRNYRAADHAFMKASRAKEEAQSLPFRVSWRHFQHAVEAAGDALPEKLRAALEEVSLILSDYAEPVLLDGFDEPELLGLFVGEERGDLEAGGSPTLTPRIYLFRRAHEHSATSRREFDLEVQQTLYHELGHYLGYDEDELDALGRG